MATPMRKQLTYLHRLAEATGTTFTPPRTTVEASREGSRTRTGPASTGRSRHLARWAACPTVSQEVR